MRSPPILWTLALLAAAVGAGEPPVAPGAPAATAPTGDTRAVSAEPAIKRISGTRYRLGSIEFDKETREISFPAKVNLVKGLLEYVIVHDEGKLHESLLATPARAFDLNVVLLLLDYQPMPEWFERGQPRALDRAKTGSRIELFVHWEDAKAGKKTARLETWVTDASTKKPAIQAPWVYNGSGLNDARQFSAEVDGSIAALYLDDRALLNSPRPGNTDDERWMPARGIPAKGTPVTVVLKPVLDTPPPTQPPPK